MYHFTAIGQFKLELRSVNAKFGSNLTILSHSTLNFDGWPWKTTGHLFYATSSFVRHFIVICEIKLELQSANADIGSGQNRFYCPVWPWNGWPWNTVGHLFYATASFAHHLVAMYEFKLELQFGNSQIGTRFVLTLTLCMFITFVNGNDSWKFHDNTMKRTLWKRCDRRTNGQTDGRTDGLRELFLELLGRS